MRIRLIALLGLGIAAAAEAQGPLDLEALVASRCGPAGYRQSAGCEIELPHGVFDVLPTRVGGCTTTTARVGVTIRGHASGLFATSPPLPMAGTTLRYAGPRGGRMLNFCAVSNLTLERMAIDAAGAGVAIRVSSDHSASAISHFVHLEDLTIKGAGVGVEVTGQYKNDQTDFVTLERVSISDVEIGYLQDSAQSVGGRLETIEVVARSAGYVLRGGSLDCNGCYVGNLPREGFGYDPEFIGFHLTRSTVVDGRNLQRFMVSIRNSHMELRSGRFIVEDSGGSAPILTQSNSYSLQCPVAGCEMLVADSQSKGGLIMIGDVIIASSNPFAYPSARVCQRDGRLQEMGVVATPMISAMKWTCAND